jgi:Mg-chelatase subunit ChlI
MKLIDRIMGKKTLEVVRNIDGSFEVSTTGGQEVQENLVEKYKEILDDLSAKTSNKRSYKIQVTYNPNKIHIDFR